jgi:hypothetical protein
MAFRDRPPRVPSAGNSNPLTSGVSVFYRPHGAPLLDVHGLAGGYTRAPVLRDVDLHVLPDEIVARTQRKRTSRPSSKF